MLAKLQNLSPTVKGFLVAGVATMTIGGLILIILMSSFFHVRGEVRTREFSLNATDLQSQAILDEVTRNFATTAGIANVKTDKLKAIMADAVQGRYQIDGAKTGAQPTGGAMFSAISEAYPNVDLTQYDQLTDIVVSGNARWSNQQQKMADKAREYQTYINTGGATRSLLLATLLRAPSDKLKVTRTVDGQTSVLTGQAALDAMQVVIQSNDTKDAFGTGELEPQVMPGSEPAVAPVG